MTERARTTFWLCAAVALVLSPLFLVVPLRVSSHAAEPAASARRQLVNLNRAERDAVRDEMRQMLASVNGVVRGVADGDLATVEKAARASGMASAVDPKLERKLPRAFLEMGERVHHGFDDIADAAKGGAGKDALLTKLADVSGTCVACHAVYRFVGTR